MSLFDNLVKEYENSGKIINNNSSSPFSSNLSSISSSSLFNNNNYNINSTRTTSQSLNKRSNIKEKCKHCGSNCKQLLFGMFGCTIECSLKIAMNWSENIYDLVYAKIVKQFSNCNQKPAPKKNRNQNTQNYWNIVLNNLYSNSDERYISLVTQLKENLCTNENNINIYDHYRKKNFDTPNFLNNKKLKICK